MMIEGIEALKGVTKQWETAICAVAGTVAGLLIGFDGYVWGESVAINRISLFAVPWLALVMLLLMRWAYAPQQRKFLYWAMFSYGICGTIHQTLILSVMGVEVLLALVQPKLGRDLLAVNSLFYLLGLACMGSVPAMQNMSGIEKMLFHIVGVGSLTSGILLCIQTKGLGSEWKSVVMVVIVGLLGLCFYFYEPLSGMTVPPMQWGYPREVEGFFHALSRGQYESTTGTDILHDPKRFANQLWYLVQGLSISFSWVFMFIGVLPFFFLTRMPRRLWSWLGGLCAIYFCLSVLLVILLNVGLDRSSADLNEVFFTASHMLFSILIGLGLALLAAYTATHYENFRPWGLGGGILAILLAVYCLDDAAAKLFFGPAGKMGLLELPGAVVKAFRPYQYNLPVVANLILVLIPVILVGALLVYRGRGPVLIMLGLFLAMPLYSALTHWYKSEQRDHWFGYWFGHDMFTPPFGIYPEMTRDAVLFGGTDPGRFCPTYMIFCESFIPHNCQPKEDQKFDRRDVYIITQNALADGTYLEYLRSQYNRSKQIDQPFFCEFSKCLFGIGVHAVRKLTGEAIDANAETEPDPYQRMNMIQGEQSKCADIANSGLFWAVNTCLSNLLDRPFTAWGARVEKKRRAEGVYPKTEIHIPTPEESQLSFQQYTEDAHRRQLLGQLKAGEEVHEENGRVSVSGQTAVMEINGLLCRNIFDACPTNEFFVEESFPLDWMYPYETPFGIIMKINRQPVPELSEEVLQKDHAFWTKYSERLNGNWLTYETPVQEIAKFVEKHYIGNNLEGYKGDPKFLRDDDGQKAFSKLRSSIAGMYAWRCGLPEMGTGRVLCPPEYRQKSEATQKALLRETDFAFKQAFAFCPYSPEAVFRYMYFLLPQGRIDDAIVVAQTCLKLDPFNEQMVGLVKNLQDMKQNGGGMATQAGVSPIQQAEDEVKKDPTNLQKQVLLGRVYFQSGQTDLGWQTFDRIAANPQAGFDEIMVVAQYCAQLRNLPKLEVAMKRLVILRPDEPEVYYDLAALESVLNQPEDSLKDLKLALDKNKARKTQDPKQQSPGLNPAKDPRFDAVRKLPEFQKLVSAY